MPASQTRNVSRSSRGLNFRIDCPDRSASGTEPPKPRLWIYHRPEIRRLGSEHEADISNLMLDLDATSRYARFGFPMSDVRLVQYCHGAVATAGVILGTYLDGGLRGLAEVYDIGVQGAAEVAFVVDRPWRDHGLGTALLKAAMRWAAEGDRTLLRMMFSARNWPMRRLAGKADAKLDLVLGELVADVAVGRACAAGTFNVKQPNIGGVTCRSPSSTH